MTPEHTNDQVTTDARVGGVVAGGAGCQMIELDVDGDGAADAYTFTGANDEFFYDLGAGIDHGEHTVRARAGQWDDALNINVYSEWESLGLTYVSSDIQVDPHGFMTGYTSSGEHVYELYVEIDYDGDGWADAYTMTEKDGYFEYDMSDDLYNQYGQHTIQMRTVYVDWDMGIYDDSESWTPLSFELKKELPPPVISNFVAREVEDGIWLFEGNVSYEGVTKLRVEFDGLLSNHNVDVDLNVTPDGFFSYGVYLEPNESGPVFAQVLESDDGQSNRAAYVVV